MVLGRRCHLFSLDLATTYIRTWKPTCNGDPLRQETDLDPSNCLLCFVQETYAPCRSTGQPTRPSIESLPSFKRISSGTCAPAIPEAADALLWGLGTTSVNRGAVCRLQSSTLHGVLVVRPRPLNTLPGEVRCTYCTQKGDLGAIPYP